ncbi:MAG: hypothetical protein KFF77_12545 [Bacteroidetes bacterium]|nr:hypothetical protein [Bacteroidota bacterium]
MRWILALMLTATVAQAQYHSWQRIDDVDRYGFKQLFVLDDSAAYLVSWYSLYRSDDGGRFWREVISAGHGGGFSHIEPDPAAGPSALVMTNHLRIDDKGTECLYTSTDGGVTWNYRGGAVGNTGGYPYPAGMGSFYMTSDQDYMVHIDHLGVARKYTEGIPSLEVKHIRHFATFDDNRALCHTWPGTVYVSGNGWAPWHQRWTPANTGLEDDEVIQIFTDGDDAWAALTVNGIKRAKRPTFEWRPANAGLGDPGSPSMFVRRIFRDKRGPLMALTEGGYYRSTDGDHWTSVGAVLPDFGKPGRTAIDFQGRYFVLYGRDSIIVSEDEARTWELRHTGLEMDSVRDILLQNGELYSAGAPCLFVTGSLYYHAYWRQRIEGLPDPEIRSLVALPDSSVVAFDMNGVASRFPPGSTTWRPLSNDLAGEVVTRATVSPDGLLLAGTASGVVAVSSDGGRNWAFGTRSIASVPIRCVLAVSDSLLFAGTFGEGLLRSSDGGVSWLPASSGLTHPNITALARTPDGDLYAGSYGAGVFRSTDLGLSWTPTAAASPGRYVTDIATNFIGALAVATYDAGVCRSHNDGLEWSTFNEHQFNLHFIRLLHAARNNVFYAVTDDGAIYRGPFGLPTAIDGPTAPRVFELHSAWPNPFRDRIEVAFELERPATMRLALTDLLGREVAVREEYIPDAGDCHRTLLPVSLSPGVYMLTLEAEGRKELRVMTFLR